jgi:hypothetical protein
MKRKDVLKYLNKQRKNNREEEKVVGLQDGDMELSMIKDLSEIEIKNAGPPPAEEDKKRSSKRGNGGVKRFAEDEIDEVVDGDEGIVNRRLPIN